jgi:Sulfotransferase domain
MIETTQLELRIRGLLRKHIPRSAPPDPAYDPYDVEALQRNAARLLEEIRLAPSQEPEQKCRDILGAIQSSYPTTELAGEYFANLELAHRGKPRREAPGQIVIGVGPGRCGSTSLSQMLGTIADSCCTHEGPPSIFWRPMSEQVDFHIRRFRMLADYYAVVSDVSHWWLNALGQIWDRLPDARVIGLVRDPGECASSFMRIQGFGQGSLNPWAPRGDKFWRTGLWDATYPSYPVPDLSKRDPDQVKLEQIRRYVREYNEEMARLAESQPGRVKLAPTERLSSPEIQAEIFAMTRHSGESAVWRLNVKSVRDGKKNQIKI